MPKEKEEAYNNVLQTIAAKLAMKISLPQNTKKFREYIFKWKTQQILVSCENKSYQSRERLEKWKQIWSYLQTKKIISIAEYLQRHLNLIADKKIWNIQDKNLHLTLLQGLSSKVSIMWRTNWRFTFIPSIRSYCQYIWFKNQTHTAKQQMRSSNHFIMPPIFWPIIFCAVQLENE